jgi:hypothetical protein
LNLSPILNPQPGLVILNPVTSNNVEPIPTFVVAAPTSTLSKSPLPVSVVAPSPRRDTPTTSRFSYDGSGITIVGLLLYPVPPPTIVNASVPPAPTVAVIVAAVPV